MPELGITFTLGAKQRSATARVWGPFPVLHIELHMPGLWNHPLCCALSSFHVIVSLNLASFPSQSTWTSHVGKQKQKPDRSCTKMYLIVLLMLIRFLETGKQLVWFWPKQTKLAGQHLWSSIIYTSWLSNSKNDRLLFFFAFMCGTISWVPGRRVLLFGCSSIFSRHESGIDPLSNSLSPSPTPPCYIWGFF